MQRPRELDILEALKVKSWIDAKRPSPLALALALGPLTRGKLTDLRISRKSLYVSANTSVPRDTPAKGNYITDSGSYATSELNIYCPSSKVYILLTSCLVYVYVYVYQLVRTIREKVYTRTCHTHIRRGGLAEGELGGSHRGFLETPGAGLERQTDRQTDM